ncbi:MAG: hypothetical protein HY080_15190 [Gammaproteobacteria bacterium]|nr:hypothetical protein [Gammaproteobacteria bacterium]
MNQQSEQSAEFNGHCAFAVSLGKKEMAGNESYYVIQDGKKYLFSNPIVKFLWRVIPGRKNKAESIWLNK